MAGTTFDTVVTVTVENVGAIGVETSISPGTVGVTNVMPATGSVERVRVLVSAGTAINQVRAQLSRRSSADPDFVPFDVFFGTGSWVSVLVAQPYDLADEVATQAQQYFYDVRDLNASGAFGTQIPWGDIFLTVAVDDANADHTVVVEIVVRNLVGEVP